MADQANGLATLTGERLEAFLAELAAAPGAAAAARCLTDTFAAATGARRVLLYVLDEGETALRLAAGTSRDTAADGRVPEHVVRDGDAPQPLFAAALSLVPFASNSDAPPFALGAGAWLAVPLPQPQLQWSSPPAAKAVAIERAGPGWRPVTPSHGERRGRVGLAPLGVAAIQLANGTDPQAVVETLLPAAALAGPILSRGLAVEQYRDAAERLDRQRDLLTELIDSLPDPVLLVPAGGWPTSRGALAQNRRATRLFDEPGSSDIAHDAAHRRIVEANRRALGDALAQGATRVARELALRDPDGGAPLFELCDHPLHGTRDGRRGDARLLVLRDVTALRGASAELERLNADLEARVRAATADLAEQNTQLQWQSQELERANRLKSEFLASMSHELRTPINALIGYTALLRDHVYGDLTPKQEDGLRRIHTSAEHLLAVINDILDLARIEAGKMPVYMERVSVGPLLREATMSAEMQARAKGLEFHLELPAEPIAIRTDPEKLRQVLGNLLSNAVKFTARGGVTVRAEPKGGRVRIEVADTGIGIRTEDLEAIWEDFRQLDQSRTREYGGTGLGLSIVRKLAERLDATVSVRSEPEVGSVFAVSVPAAQDEAVGAPDGAVRPLPASPPAA